MLAACTWVMCTALASHATAAPKAPPSEADTLVITGEESLSANYLAARYAQNQRDYATASVFFQRAMADDPKNVEILEKAFLLNFADGNLGEALQLAPRILKSKADHKLAALLLSVKALKDGKNVTALNLLTQKTPAISTADAKAKTPDVTARLLQAWVLVAQGKPVQGQAILAALKGPDWLELYTLYHASLIEDMHSAGPKAPRPHLEALLKKLPADAKALRLQEVVLRLLARAQRVDDATARVKLMPDALQKHPLIAQISAQLEQKKPFLPPVRTGVEGAAEVFFDLGSVLSHDDNEDLAAMYLYLSVWLKPDFDVAWMALGEVYADSKVSERAVEAFRHIAPTSVFAQTASLELAAHLLDNNEPVEAEQILKRLIADRPDEIEPRVALGSLYRQQKKFELAVSEYSAAIAKLPTPQPRNWHIYYYRGMSFERLNNFEMAEKDLEQANVLHENDASLLNYLGYIWADNGKKLPEAKALIEKAVQMRPGNGYYIDSLAWVHYRMGNLVQALQFAQFAVEEKPNDATIIDHYADILWRTGAILDAKYHWQHALNAKPEEAALIKDLELKLQFGLNKAGKPAQSATETHLFEVLPVGQ